MLRTEAKDQRKKNPEVKLERKHVRFFTDF